MKKHVWECRSLAELPQVAEAILPYILTHRKVQLAGDLGAGKTTFVKSLCQLLGVTTPVTSPTFALVNEYEGRWKEEPLLIRHADFYRLETAEEAWEIGFEDFLDDHSILLLEWADLVADYFPDDGLLLSFTQLDEVVRKIEMKG